MSYCNNVKSGSTSVKATTNVMTGDRGYINTNTYVALTKDDLDLMINYINASNNDGLNEMILTGKVSTVKSGTEVNVVDRTFASLNVSYSGGSGWLPKEFVSKK